MILSTFIAQTLLALALGSFIGLERQWHRRLVDLKTNALVSMGAALFMMVSATASGFDEPIRMAAQIVVGVGFLGGGLLSHGDDAATKGINTAATLWCSAAIGTLCGMGRLAEAVVASCLLVLANTVLRDVARRLKMRMGLNDSLTEMLRFDVECDYARRAEVRRLLEAALVQRRGELRSVGETRTDRGTSCLNVVAALESRDVRQDIDSLLNEADGWDLVSLSWHRL